MSGGTKVEFAPEFIELFFGLLDTGPFACTYYYLGPPWANRSSITESIFQIIAGEWNIMDFVSLCVIVLNAVYTFIDIETIIGWIRAKQAISVDWKHIFSPKYLSGHGGADTPYLTLYRLQVALMASVILGLFLKSPLVCYLGMTIFMTISLIALSFRL
jgi:hypothetical protein